MKSQKGMLLPSLGMASGGFVDGGKFSPIIDPLASDRPLHPAFVPPANAGEARITVTNITIDAVGDVDPALVKNISKHIDEEILRDIVYRRHNDFANKDEEKDSNNAASGLERS